MEYGKISYKSKGFYIKATTSAFMVHQNFTQIKIKVPKGLVESIDLLVDAGLYPNRNEVIRDSIRMRIEEAEKNG